MASEGKGEESGKGPIIGVDLGTTHSCVGIWDGDGVKFAPSDQGNGTIPKIPSYIVFTDTERLIAKRYTFSEETVQSDNAITSSKVNSAVADKPMIKIMYKNEDKQFAAEEISSMVVMTMKEIAEAFRDSGVKDTLVTVPAYFGDLQRDATKIAGAIAGLPVLGIISEPPAAAIASSSRLDKLRNIPVQGQKDILFFDLEREAFDTLLLTVEQGIFEVNASVGDIHLRGEGVDNRLVDHFTREFKKTYKKYTVTNPRALRRTVQSEPDEESSEDAKVDESQTRNIVSRGGYCRIPKVHQLLQNVVNGKELCKDTNFEEIGAYGAAVHAAILNGEANEKVEDVVWLDVAPLTLVFESASEVVTTPNPGSSTIPTNK